MLYEQLTHKIIGCAMKIHTAIGNGFQEIIYQRALAIEFRYEGVEFTREHKMQIYYRNEDMDRTRRMWPPVHFIIVRGSGDLSYGKLTPALYNLYVDGLMHEKFSIVGVARTEYGENAYTDDLLDGIVNFSRRNEEDRKWT